MISSVAGHFSCLDRGQHCVVLGHATQLFQFRARRCHDQTSNSLRRRRRDSHNRRRGAAAQRHQKHRVIFADVVIHSLLQRRLFRRHQVVVADDIVDFHGRGLGVKEILRKPENGRIQDPNRTIVLGEEVPQCRCGSYSQLLSRHPGAAERWRPS